MPFIHLPYPTTNNKTDEEKLFLNKKTECKLLFSLLKCLLKSDYGYIIIVLNTLPNEFDNAMTLAC